jgi:hypothetical protein
MEMAVKQIAFTARLLQIMPDWDAVRRELWLGDVLVKRFRQPARNQEAILAAFQEEGWPARIDDPLSGGDNVDSHDRLHDAVRRLNQQKVRLIEFRSDGLGKGILWDLRKKPAPKKGRRSAR